MKPFTFQIQKIRLFRGRFSDLHHNVIFCIAHQARDVVPNAVKCDADFARRAYAMSLSSDTNVLQLLDKFWHRLPTSLPTKDHLMDGMRSAGITQGINAKLLFFFWY